VALFALLPETVMGGLMLYLMAGQLAGSLAVLMTDPGVAEFSGGLTVGLPLMVGLVVSFAPAAAFAGFPELIRPLVANGFVMGLVTAVILEHMIFKKSKALTPTAPE
jgi:xanthine/uracil permease